MDLLPSQFHKDHDIRGFTLCYLSEAREGETLRLQWELGEDGVIRIDADREEGAVSAGHSRVFSAQILF